MDMLVHIQYGTDLHTYSISNTHGICLHIGIYDIVRLMEKGTIKGISLLFCWIWAVNVLFWSYSVSNWFLDRLNTEHVQNLRAHGIYDVVIFMEKYTIKGIFFLIWAL